MLTAIFVSRIMRQIKVYIINAIYKHIFKNYITFMEAIFKYLDTSFAYKTYGFC